MPGNYTMASTGNATSYFLQADGKMKDGRDTGYTAQHAQVYSVLPSNISKCTHSPVQGTLYYPLTYPNAPTHPVHSSSFTTALPGMVGMSKSSGKIAGVLDAANPTQASGACAVM